MKKVLIVLLSVVFLISVASVTLSADEKCKEKTVKECHEVVKCPVSGEVIKDVKKAVKGEYKGKALYFCSEECKTAFEKDPEKYVKKCKKDCKEKCKKDSNK